MQKSRQSIDDEITATASNQTSCSDSTAKMLEWIAIGKQSTAALFAVIHVSNLLERNFHVPSPER
eukprot:m.675634 g.675634  ORF g.675634 m.675634 type:complete len:65 (+) comp22788_c1_seq49:680-874(+)